MYSFTKREQIVILVIVFIIVSIFGYKFVLEDKINSREDRSGLDMENQKIESEKLVLEDLEQVEDHKSILVHISGQVYNPGLIELQNGDRINDAVELAGGLKKDADTDRINLAKKVHDEEKIYIPKIGEDLEKIESIEEVSDSQDKAGKIDINNCTKELLMSLPGIGEVTAEKIINYRKDFKFEKIEDIMQVSGIGDKKFQAIKDLIIVK